MQKNSETDLNLENATPMMVQYLKIKQDNLGCLLFYRMGDFYELFFDDAVKASKALDITLTKRGRHNGEDIPMCGVPVHSHESYLARLIKKGFKVAVCEQLEDPAEAKKRGSKSVVKRDVVRLITSGTITEDTLLDTRKNNYLACVVWFKEKLGLAWVDVSTGDFYTQEITTHNKQDKKTALQAVLSRLSANEILVAENLLAKDSDLLNVFDDYQDFISLLPPSKFNFDNAKKRLENFFEVQTLDAFGGFSNAEIIAGGVLIDYVDITQKGKMPRFNKPTKIARNEFMEIDSATRRNLELITSLSGDGKGSSLLSVIDKTITGQGARLLAKYLAEPLTSPQKINTRLDMVEFFINAKSARYELRKIFNQTPDIERAISRISLGRGSPRDLASIKYAVLKIPEIKMIIKNAENEGVLFDIYQEIVAKLGNYDDLANLLARALNEELPFYARDGGFIAKGYSDKLDELKKLRDESRVLIAELQTKYISQTGVSTLKIKHNNVIGYYIEVPSKQAEKLIETKNNEEGTVFLHRQTLIGNMRFATVELAELEDRIREAGDKSLALELELFEALINEIKFRSEDLAKTAGAIAVLDVASSLAELAEMMNYTRPLVDDSFDFEITKGRHPVVEKALYESNQSGFIANDCALNDDEKGHIWLLTGPNMAGKSTFLRQNALIAVMAQIGSFVPCEKAKIGVINKLFSRVGASDDLARGRSTFMVEMVETASILNQADERSFVILDEIGRGTATFDGLSIAWAVIEHLHDINKSRALFATHYHELTNLSQRLPHLSLQTMKVKEWQGDIIFMHEVIKGTADRSYGIHVAKIAGLPKEVIKRSEEVLTLLESRDYGTMAEVAADILPLFASAKIRNIKISDEPEKSKVEQELGNINPDNLSPKEALDEIYRLKKIINNG